MSIRARVGGCLELKIRKFQILSRPWPGAGGYPVRCARQAATVPNLRLEIEESCLKNLSNSVQNSKNKKKTSLKIEAPGARLRSSVTLLAPRWPKMRFGAHLGLHLDGYWVASWRQDGPKWCQVGQLGAKMCPRWPTWKPRWPTWRTFGSILATCFGSWARSCQKWRKPEKRRQ